MRCKDVDLLEARAARGAGTHSTQDGVPSGEGEGRSHSLFESRCSQPDPDVNSSLSPFSYVPSALQERRCSVRWEQLRGRGVPCDEHGGLETEVSAPQTNVGPETLVGTRVRRQVGGEGLLCCGLH